MDLQSTLNISLSSVDTVANETVVKSSKKRTNDGFADHLDKKISHLEKQYKTTKSADNVDKNNNYQQVDGKSSLSKNNASAGVPNNKLESSHLDKKHSVDAHALGLNDVLTDVDIGVGLQEESLTNDVTVASPTGDILPLGNSLPLITSVNDALQQQLATDIVFDPLADTRDVALPVSALSASLQIDGKPNVKGKNVTVAYSEITSSFVQANPIDVAKFSDKLINVTKFSDKLFDGFGLKNFVVPTTIASDIGGAQENLTPLAAVSGMTANQPGSIVADKPLLTLDTPVSNPRWGNDFNQQVQWMVNKSITGAQIRLNPQQLGPIEVRVHMQHDQATISFTAQHGATREAIDAALPRLREMLSEQHVSLVDVNVSQHSFAEQHQQQQLSDDAESGLASNTSDAFTEEDELALSAGFDKSQVVYEGLFNKYA